MAIQPDESKPHRWPGQMSHTMLSNKSGGQHLEKLFKPHRSTNTSRDHARGSYAVLFGGGVGMRWGRGREENL